MRLLAILQHILAPTVSYRVRLEAAVRHLPDLEIVPSAALEVLTPREKEVLVLAAQGLTSGAIGHRLGITERGVRKHLTAVYAKTGTHSRAAAAAWWSARQR